MIEMSCITAEVARSRAQQATTDILKRLILSSVDGTAERHYGPAYATKCLQTSAGIKSILADIGIRSKLWLGNVCCAEVCVKNGQKVVYWGGFCEDAHHVWLYTEFGELVDLSISQLHRHPASLEVGGLPIPAIWWGDGITWPKILKYLPKSPIEIGLNEADMRDLHDFETKARNDFKDKLAISEKESANYPPILSGMASLEELEQLGNLWLREVFLFNNAGNPYPQWVIRRHNELTMAYDTKQRKKKKS